MSDELFEHLKNRFSEARESFRKKPTAAIALPDEDLSLLKPAERTAVTNAKNVLLQAADSLKARRERAAAIEQP